MSETALRRQPLRSAGDRLTVDALEMSDYAVSGVIHTGDVSQPFTFRISGGSLGRELDFLVPLTLLPAMKTNSRLVLPGPVSARLLAGVPDIQAVFRLWNPAYREIAVEAEPASRVDPPADGVACFFSAGLDSFYSTIKHLDEITHLVYMPTGFDQTGQAADANVRAAAQELGKPLIEVETNLRPVANAFGVSFADYGGAPLAAVALLLQHMFKRVYIGNTFSFLALPRWGSHPFIDPHWSTESLEVVHDGAEATRPMKLEKLATSDIATRRLRVCHRSSDKGDRSLNCGTCLKCFRTMIAVRAAGVNRRCVSLPDTLDVEKVADVRLDDDRDLAHVMENLRATEIDGHDEPLAAALRACLAKHGRSGATGTTVEMDDSLFLQRKLKHAERTIRKRDREIRQLKTSLSWRITAPLRAIGWRR